MEIKRRLNILAKRMTPAIEAMNVSNEMLTILKRMEELTFYAETKISRSEERKKANLPTRSEIQDKARKAENKRIAEIHNAENKERMEDQVQHKAQSESKPEAVSDENQGNEPVSAG